MKVSTCPCCNVCYWIDYDWVGIGVSVGIIDYLDTALWKGLYNDYVPMLFTVRLSKYVMRYHNKTIQFSCISKIRFCYRWL